MDTQSGLQQRYLCIRRRLEQLGYRQVFGIESLLLVEQLFVDLLHVTDELSSARLQLKRQTGIAQGHNAETECVSLIQADFLRLTRENADLHQQIAHLKENSTTSVKDVKAKLRKLENENADIKFLNNQYLHKINLLEKESCLKSQRMREFHEKSPQAVVHSQAGERKRQTVYRRQQMEIKSQLPPSVHHDTIISKNNLEDVDSMKIAEQRIATLQARIESLLKCQEGTENAFENLKKQLATRSEEVDRLSKLIVAIKKCSHTGYPSEPLQKHSVETIEKLTIQLEHSKSVNQELEKRLKEALNNTQELAAKAANAILDKERVERELHNQERNDQIKPKSLNVEISEQKSKDSPDRSYLELEDLITENEKLKMDKLELLKAKSELVSAISTRDKELAEIKILLDSLRSEKDNLTDTVTRFKTNEQNLSKEVDRLNELLLKPGETQFGMDQVLQAVERQRDYYKSRLMGDNETKSSTDDHITKHIEDERDFYKREYRYLKRQYPNRAPGETAEGETKFEERLTQLIEERDELQQALEKLERHVEEMDAKLQEVSADRDKLNKLHQDSQVEKRNITVNEDRVRLQRNVGTGNAIAVDAAALYKAEMERDKACAELQHVILSRDDVRKRLQMATESQISERKRYDLKFADLESELIRIGRERSEFSAQVGSYKVLLASIEDQVRTLETRLREADSQIAQHRSHAAEMKRLAEDNERSLKETQQLLKQKSSYGQNSEQRIFDLERNIDELKDFIEKQKGTVASLKNSLKVLDQDKDNLQMEFDSKTEKLVEAQRQNDQQGRDIYDLRLTVSSMELHIKQLSEDLRERNKNLAEIRKRLEDTGNELSAIIVLRDHVLKENKQLANDLSIMTREHQIVEQNYQAVCRERDSLKRQIQDYVSEVSRIEELLKAKEQDQSHILSQFHDLTMATSSLESHSSELEIQAGNAQLEILAKDAELKYAHDTISALNEEAQQFLSMQQTRDNEIINLQDSLARLENKMQASSEEQDNLRRELMATRDLCLKMSRDKEEIAQDLNVKMRENERMHSLISGLQHEVSELHDRVSSERANVQRLEQVLSENRHKEYQIQINNQALEAEVAAVKSKLSDAERKLTEQEMTANRYRLNLAELEMESERLRHQLTDERFQKEKASQEARRLRSSPGTDYLNLNVLHGSSSSNSPGVGASTDRSDMPHQAAASTAEVLYPVSYAPRTGPTPQNIEYPRQNV